MWTLWIVSTVIGLEEPKYTRYEEYLSKKMCVETLKNLKEEFTQNEEAFCKYEQFR